MAYTVYASGDLIAKNIGDTSGATSSSGGSRGGMKLAYEVRYCTANESDYVKGHYYLWYKLYGWFSTNVGSAIYVSYYSTGSGGYIRLTGNSGTLWNATLQDYTYRSNRSPRWSPNNPPNTWYAINDAPSGYQIHPEGVIDLGAAWNGDTFTFSYYRARFLYSNNYTVSYNNTPSASVTIAAPPPMDTSNIRVRHNGAWKKGTVYSRHLGAWVKAKINIKSGGAWKS